MVLLLVSHVAGDALAEPVIATVYYPVRDGDTDLICHGEWNHAGSSSAYGDRHTYMRTMQQRMYTNTHMCGK